MNRFLHQARTGGRMVSAELRRIRAVLESGERIFAQRVAWELGEFWAGHMSARWDTARTLVEEDIRHRAASMAQRGLSATLNSLHPAITYRSGVLRIEDEYTFDVRESRGIVLHPSPMAPTWRLSVDPWGEDEIQLSYPVARGLPKWPEGEPRAVPEPWGEVIGQARLLLLSDLGSSRTTTELAERHHLSASTVSYHLLRLHRVGLLNRTREGNKVYYQRTPEADRFVARRARKSRQQRPGTAADVDTAAHA
ncbi:helix-turn-helix domain-containing protein [Streptomyces sp. NPDC050508]|uniref:helix-turn-helix domain-containing protein n=1 Tax=Streptomyces sp. NPDC050508 TaxID=3155405 RepID=UPI0034390CE8